MLKLDHESRPKPWQARLQWRIAPVENRHHLTNQVTNAAPDVSADVKQSSDVWARLPGLWARLMISFEHSFKACCCRFCLIWRAEVETVVRDARYTAWSSSYAMNLLEFEHSFKALARNQQHHMKRCSTINLTLQPKVLPANHLAKANAQRYAQCPSSPQ